MRRLLSPLSLVALVLALALAGCSGVQGMMDKASDSLGTDARAAQGLASNAELRAARARAANATVQPSAELRAGMNCIGPRPVKVLKGTMRNYEWTKGAFEKKTSKGFLDREDVTAQVVTDDCYLDLSSVDPNGKGTYVLHYNREEYVAAVGNDGTGGLREQCVLSEDPSKGTAEQQFGDMAADMYGGPSGDEIILRAPNDTGIESVNKQNAVRDEIYNDQMEEQGLVSVEFALNSPDDHAIDFGDGVPGVLGKTFFCAMSGGGGEVLFATEYALTPAE